MGAKSIKNLSDSECLSIFCRQIRQRSSENKTTIKLLHREKIVSNAISTLRQELDSMVRVIYLLCIDDTAYRSKLIRQSVAGQKWTDQKERPIRDKDMVKIASRLKHWTKNVYEFGCGFIHLSSFHDYQERDPFDQIDLQSRNEIVNQFMREHSTKINVYAGFGDLVFGIPMVFDKISSNLECYVKELEQGKCIESS